MRAHEFIIEGYKEATADWYPIADNKDVDSQIAKYKELVNRNQISGNERNIDYWRKQGWEKFKSFLDNMDTTSKTQIKRSKVEGNSITLLENDKWLVVIPLDKNASCFHGKDTNWCTTKADASHFENYYYSKDITLIYCINKRTNQKWAISGHQKVETLELFDKQNNPIDEATFKKQTGMDARKLFNLSVSQHQEQISASKVEYVERLNRIKQILPTISTRNDTLEKDLLYTKEASQTVRYIQRLIQNNQDVSTLPPPLIRIAVINQPDMLRYYPNVPEKVKMDAVAHSSMALKFIKNPSWNVISKALETNGSAIDYVDIDYDTMLKFPRAAAWYAKKHKIRIPEIEKKIFEDPQGLFYYIDVINEPIKKYEPYILNNIHVINTYVKNALHGKPWPAAEKQLVKHVTQDYIYYLLEYAQITHQRFEKAEPKIMTEPTIAAEYALTVLKHPWEEAEPAMYKYNPDDFSGELIVNYAKEFGWGDYLDKWKVNDSGYDDN